MPDDTRAMSDEPKAGLVNPGLSLSKGDLINDRYRVGDMLGKGGFGVVYAAYDHLTDSDLALKFLFPDLGVDSERVRRIQREILTARKVRDPRLVSIYDLEIWKGIYFISMERVRGKTLGQLYDQVVDWQDFRPVFLEICRAIAVLHDQGIVHRDLKPGNIMITDSGSVKVLDFGLAKDLNTTDLTLTGSQILGSPLYLAPEQISGEEIDHRCDIYALGLILFRVLTGLNAFSETDKTIEIIIRKLKCDIPRWPGDLPAPPTVVKHILSGCLQRKPSSRFETIQTLIKAVEQQKVGFSDVFRRFLSRFRGPILTGTGVFLLLFLTISGFRSNLWLGLTSVKGEGQTLSARNGFGFQLWSHDFPLHQVIRTSLSPQVKSNQIEFRRNHENASRVIAYLSPVQDCLLSPMQSINDVSADNRLAWFDAEGRLVADHSLVEHFSVDTEDFARALYFYSFSEQDRDGDGETENLAVLIHKNSMYPAAFILEDVSRFHAFSCKGHIAAIELQAVNKREWRFLVLSQNNPFMHMCQLSEVAFNREEEIETWTQSLPGVYENLLLQGNFITLLPKVSFDSPLNWTSAGYIDFSIFGGDRRLRVMKDGTQILTGAGTVQTYQDDMERVRTWLRQLNDFYVEYYLHRDRNEGISSLMKIDDMSCKNPFLRSLILYFRAGVLLDRGQYQDAEMVLNQSLALFPESNDTVQKLCEIPFLQGAPLTAIKRVDETYPRHDNFWGLSVGRELFKAYCSLQAGHFPQAEAFMASLIIDPRRSVNLPYFMGLFNLYKGGDPSLILEQMDKGLAERSSLVTLQEYRLLLARAMLLDGLHLDRSEFYFNDLNRFSHGYKHLTRVSLAWLAYRNGNPQALNWARDGFAAMVDRSRGDFMTRFWLYYDAFLYAELMEKAGQAAEARRAYTLCVESAPHSHLAGLAMKKLSASKVDG